MVKPFDKPFMPFVIFLEIRLTKGKESTDLFNKNIVLFFLFQ